MSTLNLREAAILWLAAFTVMLLLSLATQDFYAIRLPFIYDIATKFLGPLAACVALVFLAIKVQARALSYAFFFAVSVTSLFGATQPLTGFRVEPHTWWLYGLAFCTAALAYVHHNRLVKPSTPMIVSNPLLMFTGPIALYVKSARHRRIRNRISYYLPFLILGLFLHQAVATPLVPLLKLVEKTDVVSALFFALAFELFVYANFCGLSLVVFALAGFAGYAIPLNFRQPFSATHLVDFWKGWHVSLSLILKSLFYTPLRRAAGRIIALLGVYLASALWHGVAFNFLVWGVFHAVMYVATLWLLERKTKYIPFILLLTTIVLGRLIFADPDMDRLLVKLRFQFRGDFIADVLLKLPVAVQMALGIGSVFVVAELIFRRNPLFRKRNYKFYRLPWVQLILLLIMLLTVSVHTGADYAVYGQR
jgi:alginate O-acetyltransferase complex protein AlgI